MKKIIKKFEFESKGRKLVFRSDSKKILVLEVEGKVFALDNRCPHEGYPLSEGSISGKSCVLTCNWHNWKFDLKTGKCKVGGDNVRTYPVTISKEEIHVDLSDPSPDKIYELITNGLKIAFEKRQYGRIAREISRLTYNNLEPLSAIKNSILWSYNRLEYGMTHAYAVTADWISLYQNLKSEEDKIICLTEAVDHISYDSLRHPRYPFSGRKEIFSLEELFTAIVDEDHEKAEALVESGFRQGMRFSGFEETLCRSALFHYNDFGHSLIYVTKVEEICRVFGDVQIDRALTLSLVRSLCFSTKEDLIPEFESYKKTIESVIEKGFGSGLFFQKIPDKSSVKNSLEWFRENVDKSNPTAFYESFLLSNAENFLRFDQTYQNLTNNLVSQNVGWLDFTHAITFSNAVRKVCTKYPSLWAEGLAQMICFYGRNNSYTKEIDVSKWEISKSDLREKSLEIILDHGIGLPIFSSHLTKTFLALLEEVSFFEKAKVSQILCAAMNRFISSPLKQKHVRRSVYQGIKLISRDFK